MILGRGTAQTQTEIIAEYHQLLRNHGGRKSTSRHRLFLAPTTMMTHIGKPFAEWTDDDILHLFQSRSRTTRYVYITFLIFLFFRGYRQATLPLLAALQPQFSCHFKSALEPIRERMLQTLKTLHYKPSHVGSELNLLINMLAVVGKPLEELTRVDFESFRNSYEPWYRHDRPYATGKPDPHLFRLEVYLVHWKIMEPAKVVFQHDIYFSQLQSTPFRETFLTHMEWCEVHYKESSIRSRRAALLNFFLWLEEHHPHCVCLDQVTRSIALAYARNLKQKLEEGVYSAFYACGMYRDVRLFFDFAIDERLQGSPDRNPFTQRDMPRRPNSMPRYLSDQQIRKLLAYCDNVASLKEKTLIITLLHTGIRASELAALQVTDIVQIQGAWKLHIHQGKGLKDRIVPLTPQCLEVLQTWQKEGWEGVNNYFFTHHGQRWHDGRTVCYYIREVGHKLEIENLTPHRFRHTFAVTLLNYGMRESALQKLMGHATVGMTLEYARILDKSVEKAFNTAVEQMQVGPASWVPSFFNQDEYALLAHGEEALNWIRLPHGFCRRHPKLHCESDVKCLLCERYCATPSDLPQLQEMHERFLHLGMQVKADVVNAHIIRLKDVVVGEVDWEFGDMPLEKPSLT